MTTVKWALPCLVVAILAAIGLVRLGLSRSSDAQVVLSLAPNAQTPRELLERRYERLNSYGRFTDTKAGK